MNSSSQDTRECAKLPDFRTPAVGQRASVKQGTRANGFGGSRYGLDRDAVDVNQTLGSPCALTRIVAPGGDVI